MTSGIRSFIVVAIISFMALPAMGQQYHLYTPVPFTDGQKKSPQTGEGILVREIEVQKGDTLYDISKKFSGRGMYFPQILLFNSIKNPNLIYPGKTLKVPVTDKEAGTSEQAEVPPAASTLPQNSSNSVKSAGKAETARISGSGIKGAGTEKSRPGAPVRKAAVTTKKTVTRESSASPPQTLKSKASAGQKLYEAAVKAYRNNDCNTAIELFDRYLADSSGSPLAADANLYKAECYLKMSAQ